jgi:FMN phosphatase YigB (HAD superfamily)
VVDVMKTLGDQYRLVLVTNAAESGENEIRAALEVVGLGPFLDRIYCFRKVGHKKPSPEFFT